MKNIFENNKSVENLIDSTMQNLHKMVDANTIVGEPIISPDGAILIPISKVSVGYIVGGGEYTDITKRKNINNFPLAGGSGGGVSVSPVGILISKKGEIKYIDIESKNAFENTMEIINKITEKLTKENKNENQ